MLERNIEENYEAIAAAGTRSYEQIADQADKDGAKSLAAWARKKAALGGDDVTPNDAEAGEQPYAKRSAAEVKDLAKERGLGTFSTKQDAIDALEKADEDARAAAAKEAEGEYAELSDVELRELAVAAKVENADQAERADLIAGLRVVEQGGAGGDAGADAGNSPE